MTFLEKYELLKKSIPVVAVFAPNTVDSEYVENTFGSKNCCYCFDCYRLENSFYTISGWGNRLVDCRAVIESEECYQCVDCNKCYNSTYLFDCNNSLDCHFSVFLNSC